jgi:hypothetical protein
LSRDFGNLREVVQSSETTADSLVEPVLDRFCETLDAVSAAWPELQDQCLDLQERLRRFLEPAERGPDFPDRFDEDMSF